MKDHMDLNAGMVDQKVNAFVDKHREAMIEKIGPQAKNDEHKLKSAAFALMCLQALRSIDDEEALDCLTEGGQDAGVDAIHIGDVIDGEFVVTIANSKYSKSLDAASGFPANAIVRVISTIRLMFDPDASLSTHPRLEEIVTEIRSLIVDGNFPDVRVMLCNNGAKWEQNGQDEIDQSGVEAKRVTFHYVNHDRLVEFYQRRKAVEAKLRLSGKAIVDEFDYRRVLVGRVPVSEIKTLFDTHGDTLLDRNIRRYLGLRDNRVNLGIHNTLTDESQRSNFYFFNNGITGICTKFTHNALQEGNWTVQVTGLQIVNGGQTCKTIQRTLGAANVENYEKAFVLLRLYELAAPQDDDVVNRITLATNSQNPVDLTDLRSNDPIQERLSIGLKDLGFDYKRKRDEQVSVSADVITSAVAAEAVMAAWRRKPNAAKFRRVKLFSDFYNDVFSDDLQASHVVLSVLIFRLVETARKRREADRSKFVPYASHFLAMVVADLLLKKVGIPRDKVTHLNLAEIRSQFDEHKDRLYKLAVKQVGAALKRVGITEETPLPRIAAQFRRGDLLDPLQAALSSSSSEAAQSGGRLRPTEAPPAAKKKVRVRRIEEKPAKAKKPKGKKPAKKKRIVVRRIED